MSGKNNGYDWAAYYAAAYEKERKQNIALADRLADAERRQADCRDHLDRICGNPFWRLTAPARRLYHGIKGGGQSSGDERRRQENSMDRSSVESACFLHYKEEVERQKNRYREWINNTCSDKGEAELSDPPEIHGWTEIEIPDTDVIIVAYGCGRLTPGVFRKIRSFFQEKPSCMLAYGDEDFYIGDLSHRREPWLKPCYSPDTLLAFNYWGHMIAVRKELLSVQPAGRSMLGPHMSEAKESSTTDHAAVAFYDLCLRLEEAVLTKCSGEYAKACDRICHMDAVLYHQRYDGKDLEAELEAGRFLIGASAEFLPVKQEALCRRGIHGSFRPGQDPDIYHVIYDTSVSGRERCARACNAEETVAPHRIVSVVIPSRDHPEVLETCLRTFRQRTAYPYYEWIVVDNGSNAENKAKMEALQKKYSFCYLYEPMPFNFSRMCNLGVKRARGDLVLLLNDDIEIIEESWLTRMAGQAMQPHVGAVGAKLWYAGTEQIQHAGITNLQIGPSHKLITFPDDRDYYYGRNRVVYDMIGVTGACLMVSREKYEQVGGMDEEMAVAYNDVDLCFKLIEAGYFNVQRNDAVLYHHESLSRGLDEEDAGKWERLLAEKANLYAKHPALKGKDPFYHKELADNASDYSCNYKFVHEEHLRTMETAPLEQELLKKAKPGRLQLTVDRAEPQHKIHIEEPDIIWIMGWCYVPGADNAAYDKTILLQKQDGTGYRAEPADWYRKDVEAILPGECHIGLAGFVLRLRREDLQPGEYRIGMLCQDIAAGSKGQKLIAWSDKTVVVAKCSLSC